MMQKITVTQDDINHPSKLNPVALAVVRALGADEVWIGYDAIAVYFGDAPYAKYFLPAGAQVASTRFNASFSVEPFEFYTEPL